MLKRNFRMEKNVLVKIAWRKIELNPMFLKLFIPKKKCVEKIP